MEAGTTLRRIEEWTGHREPEPDRPMKTTAAGIIAALVVILGEVTDLLDESTTTAFQVDVVAAQCMVAWGLFQAANRKP